MLRRSHLDIREDETPEPEDLPDLPDLAAERDFANAVIVEGLKRNPERARQVIAHVARSFAESGRYSAGSTPPSTSFWKLEAHSQTRQ